MAAFSNYSISPGHIFPLSNCTPVLKPFYQLLCFSNCLLLQPFLFLPQEWFLKPLSSGFGLYFFQLYPKAAKLPECFLAQSILCKHLCLFFWSLRPACLKAYPYCTDL